MKPTRRPKYIKHSEISDNSNEYVILLKRLDEEDGLIEPSIEEKLKLTEDCLRLSCARFCEVTANLFKERKKDETDTSNIVEPQTIQQLFEAKSLKPSFRPPKTELTTLSKENRNVCSLKTSFEKSQADDILRKKQQQAYYLPPSSWFSSQKSSIDLSNEEVELLSSCATKAFVKFLSEKKMEVPKIFNLHYRKYVVKEDGK